MVSINDLHKNFVAGEPRAEDELFRRLTVSFSLFVRHRVREEADVGEIVQDALAVVASKFRSIEFSTSFSAWSYKILEHVLLRYYRSKGNREKMFVRSDELVELSSTVDPDPDLKVKLLDCLRQLGKTRTRHARILTLHFQGYSVGEISDRIGVSTNNFYVMLSRARGLLQNCLNLGESYA